jgi:hypothetical protein
MPFQAFSNLDIKKLFPDFDSKRLTEWRHKEYIRNLIPEAVYTQKAITMRKTISYTTTTGTFGYHSLKPNLFFGYTILHKDRLPIMIAEIEKAILDYSYLNSLVVQ